MRVRFSKANLHSNEQCGAQLVEAVLLTALIAVVCIGAMRGIGKSVSCSFANAEFAVKYAAVYRPGQPVSLPPDSYGNPQSVSAPC